MKLLASVLLARPVGAVILKDVLKLADGIVGGLEVVENGGSPEEQTFGLSKEGLQEFLGDGGTVPRLGEPYTDVGLEVPSTEFVPGKRKGKDVDVPQIIQVICHLWIGTGGEDDTKGGWKPRYTIPHESDDSAVLVVSLIHGVDGDDKGLACREELTNGKDKLVELADNGCSGECIIFDDKISDLVSDLPADVAKARIVLN